MFYQQPLIVQLVKQPDAEARPLTELFRGSVKGLLILITKEKPYETLFGRDKERSQRLENH